MTKKHQEELRKLLRHIDPEHGIEVKPFFGGAASYTNESIFASLTKAGFALKLALDDREKLLQVDGAKKLQYFPNAPIKKAYVVLPDSMVRDEDALQEWIGRSLKYVSGGTDT
jgi:TfoX/Sxy family transcriptional regulator of competence genes